MRILFRGKRNIMADGSLKGDWVYGGYHKHLAHAPNFYKPPKDKEYEYLILADDFTGWDELAGINATRVISETLGQYAGFSDRLDNDVFTSDIVQLYSGTIVKVEFRDGAFGYVSPLSHDFISFAQLFNVRKEERDIILLGNVFDNPELLKGEES